MPEKSLAALGDFSSSIYEKLDLYVSLLSKWNKHINLVSQNSIDDVWQRHILDSAQLIDYIDTSPAPERIFDFGSGAGLPGLILAILGLKNITLVESDARKVEFLREASRITATDVVIVNKRIEALDPTPANIIIARACAPLNQLLNYAEPMLSRETKCLFLKGKNAKNEISALKEFWHVTETIRPSMVNTSPHEQGYVVELNNIMRKEARE